MMVVVDNVLLFHLFQQILPCMFHKRGKELNIKIEIANKITEMYGYVYDEKNNIINNLIS